MGCEGVLWDPGTPWVSSPLDDVGLPEQRIADGHVQVAEVESRGLGPAACESDLSRSTLFGPQSQNTSLQNRTVECTRRPAHAAYDGPAVCAKLTGA